MKPITQFVPFVLAAILISGFAACKKNDDKPDEETIRDRYDYHDDNHDGITWFNAQRFYYMWYDALLFGPVMKRIYITAEPAK